MEWGGSYKLKNFFNSKQISKEIQKTYSQTKSSLGCKEAEILVLIESILKIFIDNPPSIAIVLGGLMLLVGYPLKY